MKRRRLQSQRIDEVHRAVPDIRIQIRAAEYAYRILRDKPADLGRVEPVAVIHQPRAVVALAGGIRKLVDKRRPGLDIFSAECVVPVHLGDISIDVRNLGYAALVVLVVWLGHLFLQDLVGWNWFD